MLSCTGLAEGAGGFGILIRTDGPYAISELARALGKSRNEIYRMVIVLERPGYLVRTDTDRFAVTRKLFDLAMHAPPQRNLLAKALPVMECLSEETSGLTVLSPVADCNFINQLSPRERA